MTRKTFKREFTEFGGVNLRADDINRNPVFASDNQNVLYGLRGEIKKFPVNNEQMYSNIPIGAGRLHALQLYKFFGQKNGSPVEEVLGVSDTADLARLKENILNVKYTGAGVGEVKIGADNGDKSYVELYEDDVLIYSNTSYFSAISTLNTAINALADFSSTIESTVAEIRQLSRLGRRGIGADGVDCPYLIVENVDYAGKISAVDLLPPVADPTDDYVNGDSVNLNRILYFNDTNNVITKHDGHYYYPAGLWKPTLLTTSTAGGALTPGEYYTFAVRNKFVDYGGNIHYSAFEFSTRVVAGGHGSIQIQGQHNIASKGPNLLTTDFTATGAGTVLPVTDGTKFKVGEKLTANSFGVIETANVTAVTATTITVDSTIGYVNGEDVSHQYTIEVWSSTATAAAGNQVGPFYLIGEVVSINQVVNVSRSVVDSTLTTYEIIPDTEIRNWSEGIPNGVKLTKFQNSLVLRDESDKSLVHFSDQIGQEQFDLAVNNVIVEGDVIGIGATKEHLSIFKETSCDVLTGDIQTPGSVRVDRVDDNIGCVAHQTIKEIDYGVIAFLSTRGPYKMVNGIISPLGIHQTQSGDQVSRLEPWFRQTWDRSRSATLSDHTILAMKRAVAVNWSAKNLYILYVPFETLEFPIFQDFTSTEPNSWSYNYDKDAWCRLKAYYMAAGAQEDERGNLVTMNRDFTFANNNRNFLGYLHYTQNNDDSINFPGFHSSQGRNSIYSFAWNHMGSPSLLKKWLRARFFAHETINGQTGFTLNVKAEQDFKDGVTSTIDGVPLVSGTERKVKLSGMRARALRITINSIDSDDPNPVAPEDWAINGMVLEWAQPYRGESKE